MTGTEDDDSRNSRSRSAQILQKRTMAVEKIKGLISVTLPELLEGDSYVVEQKSVMKEIFKLDREIRTDTDMLLSIEVDTMIREKHLELLNYMTNVLQSEPVVTLREHLRHAEANSDGQSQDHSTLVTTHQRDGDPKCAYGAHGQMPVGPDSRNKSDMDSDQLLNLNTSHRSHSHRSHGLMTPPPNDTSSYTKQRDKSSRGEAERSSFLDGTKCKSTGQRHHIPPSLEFRDVDGHGLGQTPQSPSATFQCRLLAFNRYAHSAKELVKNQHAVPKLAIQNAISDVKSSFSKMESVTPLPPDAERIIDICFRDQEALCKSLYQFLKQAEDSATAATQASLRFEKQKIPTFSGKFRDFLSFKKKFQELVVPSMSDSLAYLRLRDEALRRNSYEYQLVRGTVSLVDAWSVLDQYFARPSLVKDSVLTDLMALHPVKNHTDAAGLRKLLAELVSAAEDLKAVGLECALGDSALSCLMTKVPTKIREKVDKRTFDFDLSSKQQLELLISLCGKYAAVEEQHLLRTQAHGFTPVSDRPRNSNLSYNHPASLNLTTEANSGDELSDGEISGTLLTGYNTAQDRINRKGRCLYNPEHTHMTSHCFQFITLAAMEMKKILEERRACFVCFEKKDSSHQCRRPRLCPEIGCSRPSSHSKFLHAAFHFHSIPKLQPPNVQTISSESLSKPADDQTDVTKLPVADPACSSVSVEGDLPGVHTLQITPGSEQQRHEVNSRLGYNTLRPCHAMFLKGRDGKMFKAQIFYDQGADLSQVRNDTVSRCAVKPVNCLENLQMKVAGNPQAQSWGKTFFYDLPLYDQDGEKVYTLPCVSVDYIGTTRKGTVETVATSFENLGYEMSDLLKPGCGVIDILVGSNCPYLLPTMVASLAATQLAMTKFGMIIYGSHPSFPEHDLKANSELVFVSTFLHTHADIAVPVDTPPADIESPVDADVDVVCVSCSSLSVDHISSIPKHEKDAFDDMVKIDDQLICYKCGKCSPGGSVLDREESRHLQVYRDCLRYDSDQKVFYTRMPWTKSLNVLPDNRDAALKRLNAVTKSLAKDDSLRTVYVSEFDKMIQSDVLSLVTSEEDSVWKSDGNPVWYVSHFPVVNPSSSSTPVRPVFDPTVPFQGVLLEKFWERPPNLIPHLPHLLIRFRERPIPVAVDFKKAYWSVRLEPLESHMHRVLWNRLDPDEPTLTYRMKHNSWGMIPSGSICSIAMLTIAEKHRELYPDVYDFISRCMYVDDGTLSVESVDQALTLARNIHWVMLQGGFTIKHFIIGGKEMELPNNDLESEIIPSVVRFGEDQERILGIQWKPANDTISFNCRVMFPKSKRQKKYTKELDVGTLDDNFPDTLSRRNFLSVMATLFDPIGLASPVTIVLKHELGRIFLLDGGWDTPIPRGNPSGPSATYERCMELIRTLLEMKSVSFPRCIRPPVLPSTVEPFIVGFADSSEMAYAACVYFNWEHPDKTCVNPTSL